MIVAAASIPGKALTPPVKKKMAALKPEELPEFLRRLEDYQGHRLTYLGMRFVIYTFVRTSELRLAEWKEFELKSANPVWTIPAERMKMRREHLVPLSKQAVQILQQVAEISGGERLVFPSQNNPNKPMSENTLLFAIYRMGYHSRARRTSNACFLVHRGCCRCIHSWHITEKVRSSPATLLRCWSRLCFNGSIPR